MKIIKKIRLKKDTPDHKAGELFVLMSNNGIYEIDAGEDDPAVFHGGDIDNFDEWFEEIKESDPLFEELTHDDERDRVAVNIWFRKNRDGSHPKKMVDFIQLMEAINVVSQDEGFMKTDFQGSGYCMRLQYVDADEVVFDRVAYVRTIRYAGAFFFDTEEHAKQSIIEHRASWQTILNYDWSRE